MVDIKGQREYQRGELLLIFGRLIFQGWKRRKNKKSQTFSRSNSSKAGTPLA